VQVELEKRRAEKSSSHGALSRDVEEVHSRVALLEGSFNRLEENVTASQRRMEDMLGQLVHGASLKFKSRTSAMSQ